MKRVLYYCSRNPGKLREFALAAEQLRTFPYRIEALPGLQAIRPPAEDGGTFEENAAIKACYYSGLTTELVFADDSGLEVDALGGAPGVYSARFAGPKATDADNNKLLLERLHGAQNRKARFVCVLALAQQRTLLGTFLGVVEGEILYRPRGANGFGYDPLFFYAPFGCSFGEIQPEQKFAISHRGQALCRLFARLQEKTREGAHA